MAADKYKRVVQDFVHQPYVYTYIHIIYLYIYIIIHGFSFAKRKGKPGAALMLLKQLEQSPRSVDNILKYIVPKQNRLLDHFQD